jgi:hypothetical protein
MRGDSAAVTAAATTAATTAELEITHIASCRFTAMIAHSAVVEQSSYDSCCDF